MPTEFFQAGGSLRHDQASYITRQADEEFYQALLAGEFCYVLNSRQMGKSSLRVRTAFRLQQQNVVCATVDISLIGTEELNLSQFYNGLIVAIKNSLELDFDDKTWRKDYADLSPVQRLGLFIEEVLLVKIQQPIVIFIDESDSIRNLSFGVDDLFALIRAFHNKRAENDLYQRLTFAILGVARPGDLITDKKRTPFNIGRAINLTGFTLAEAEILQSGLTAKVARPSQVLTAVLEWTGGQPFLTQKICQLISQQAQWIEADMEKPAVADLVHERIIQSWESQDDPQHLRTIENRILERPKQASQLLGLYQKILTAEIVAENSPLQLELQLAGLVVKRGNQLQVYNPIYAEVFTQEWITNNLANLRPYDANLRAWLANEQDSSRLLTGSALEEAEAWMQDKDLSQDDYRFLTASRVNANKRKAAKLLTQVLGIGFIIVLGMGLWAVKERQATLAHLKTIEQQQDILVKQKDIEDIALDAINNLTYETIEELDDMPNTQDLIKWLTESNLALLERINALEINTRTLREQAANLSKVGNAHLEVGEMDEALQAYQQSSKIMQQISQANPQNADLKRQLAVSYSKLGEIHKALGHVDKVLEFFELYNKLSKELSESNPKSEDLKNGLAISYEKLGDIHKVLGHVDKALEFFKLRNKLSKELSESNPKSEGLKNGLAISYSKLGDIHQDLGHVDKALEFFELRMQLSKELSESNPKSEGLKKGLANSYGMLGDLHSSLGNVDKSLEYINKATDLFKELSESNPKSESLKNHLAISYEKLGEIHQALGHVDKALEFFELDMKLTKELSESNPKSEDLKNGLAISYSKLGEIHQDLGHVDKALEFFELQVELFKELSESNPKNEGLKNGLAVSYQNLGLIHQDLGHVDKALEFFELQMELFKELSESNPKSEALKNGLAISYQNLGLIHEDLAQNDKVLKYFKLYNRLMVELHQSNPKSVELKYNLAFSCYKLGGISQDKQQAKRYYQQAIQLWQALYDLTGLEIYKRRIEIVEGLL